MRYMYEKKHTERELLIAQKTLIGWKFMPRYKSNFEPITKNQRRNVISRNPDPKKKEKRPTTVGRNPRKVNTF